MGEPAPERQPVRIRSASWIFSAQVAGLFLSVPMSILLARTLGPSGKGTLSVVQMIATFGAILLNLGLAPALTYYAAKREARGRDVVALALGVGAAVSLLAVLAFRVVGTDVTEALLHTNQTALILAGALTIGPVLAAQMLGSYVVGTGDIRRASLVNVGSLGFQLAALAILWLMGLLTAPVAIAVWVLAAIGVVVAQGRLAWNGQAKEGTETGPIHLVRRIWRYGLTAWPGGVLSNAALRADVFLLAFYKGPAAVGIYSIAVTLAELCWYVPNSIGGVLMPKVASEGEDSIHVAMRVGRITWIITALLGCLIIVAAIPIVPILFGQQFKASVLPLALITPGIVAIAFASAPSAFLNGTGHPGDWTRASVANVAANILANIILIPKFGVAGAAIASSISYSLAAVIITWFLIRRTGVQLRLLVIPTKDDFAVAASAVRSVLARAR